MHSRRQFLQQSVCGAAALACGCASDRNNSDSLTIIDTHTHFYDPTRSQGVPWPNPADPVLYRTVLPMHYLAQPQAHAVSGTVVVEASPWVDDNQWILDLARKNPFIVGFVGNLQPGQKEFAGNLKRFAANKLYRGIRIPSGSIKAGLDRPEFVADLRLLGELDLALDVNGPPQTLPDIARLAATIPFLRIVIDHHANIPMDGKTVPEDWAHDMRTVGRHRNVFAKVSGLVEGAGRFARDNHSPTEVEYYRPYLDVTWNAFGEDRLVYGSNWPVSEKFASLAAVQSIVFDFFSAKGTSALAKVFSGNASAAYKWVSRNRRS